MRDYLFKSLNESLDKRMNESVALIGDLEDYTPWSGAVATWNKIIDADKKEALDNYLEEMYPEGISFGGLNDLLWFDGDQVLRDLGLAEYPKDVEVEVTNIKFAEDVDPDDVDESTTVEITIEDEDDDVKELVLDALYDDFYRLSPGDIIDFEYKIDESCKNKNSLKKLNEEISDEAYEVAEKMIKSFDGRKKITWDEFNDAFFKATADVFGEARFTGDDFETDVRGILSYNGYGTVYEGENEGGLELAESSNLDDIDAKADDKKETAKKDFEKAEDDADADRDDEKKELNEEGGKPDVEGFVKEMKEVIPSDQINTYESDLYVLVTPKSKELLKKYDMWGNDLLSVFTDNIDHKRYFNIPFGNLGGYLKQRHGDDYGIVNADESLNESVSKDKIVSFIKDAADYFKDNTEGCYYTDLTKDLYLVVGYSSSDDEGPVMKIAYNSDDLQSDYDWDWYMPTYEDGEVAFVEISLNAENAEGDADYMIKEAESMQKEIDEGNLKID